MFVDASTADVFSQAMQSYQSPPQHQQPQQPCYSSGSPQVHISSPSMSENLFTQHHHAPAPASTSLYHHGLSHPIGSGAARASTSSDMHVNAESTSQSSAPSCFAFNVPQDSQSFLSSTTSQNFNQSSANK